MIKAEVTSLYPKPGNADTLQELGEPWWQTSSRTHTWDLQETTGAACLWTQNRENQKSPWDPQESPLPGIFETGRSQYKMTFLKKNTIPNFLTGYLVEFYFIIKNAVFIIDYCLHFCVCVHVCMFLCVSTLSVWVCVETKRQPQMLLLRLGWWLQRSACVCYNRTEIGVCHHSWCVCLGWVIF